MPQKSCGFSSGGLLQDQVAVPATFHKPNRRHLDRVRITRSWRAVQEGLHGVGRSTVCIPRNCWIAAVDDQKLYQYFDSDFGMWGPSRRVTPDEQICPELTPMSRRDPSPLERLVDAVPRFSRIEKSSQTGLMWRS
jgi:hypothetical protein